MQNDNYTVADFKKLLAELEDDGYSIEEINNFPIGFETINDDGELIVINPSINETSLYYIEGTKGEKIKSIVFVSKYEDVEDDISFVSEPIILN